MHELHINYYITHFYVLFLSLNQLKIKLLLYIFNINNLKFN